MTGPSAMGSLNGIPTSMIEPHAAANRGSSAPVDASDGYPAVMNGSTAARPDSRQRAKARGTALLWTGAVVMAGW